MLVFRIAGGAVVCGRTAFRPDELSAQAMLYCLFHVVTRVVLLHKDFRALGRLTAGSNGQARVPQDIADAVDLAEGKLGQAKEMLGMHIQPIFEPAHFAC